MAEMSRMQSLGEILQRAGAGFQGNLAQFDATRNQQQILTEDRERVRKAEALAANKDRMDALYKDATALKNMLASGAIPEALAFSDNRLGFINKLGGDPSHTQEIRDLIASGNVGEASRQLDIFLTHPDAQKYAPKAPEAQSNPGKQAVDEGLRPGTPEFAARVLQLTMPEAKQPRMVEQGGIQYWAEGPNAGKPVVAGAAAQTSPIEQFTKRFGAVPANMTPEVRDGAITGRLVPMAGGEKDPAMVEQARVAKLKEDMPAARSRFLAVSQPLQAMKAQIAEIKKDPNTADVVGAWEGRMSGGPIGRFGGDNATAASRIENLRNVAQSIGLNLTRQGGVAPGSITEREWPKFEAFIANLDTVQDEGAFKKQLEQAEAMATELITGMEEDFKKTYGESPLRRRDDAGARQRGPEYLKSLLDKYPARK